MTRAQRRLTVRDARRQRIEQALRLLEVGHLAYQDTLLLRSDILTELAESDALRTTVRGQQRKVESLNRKLRATQTTEDR